MEESYIFKIKDDDDDDTEIYILNFVPTFKSKFSKYNQIIITILFSSKVNQGYGRLLPNSASLPYQNFLKVQDVLLTQQNVQSF